MIKLIKEDVYRIVYDYDESKTRIKRNKLMEKSNFDTVDKAIKYYYPKWYYDDMSVNDIYDSLEKLGHSQDFIDAVIDGITDRYENEEDYGLDDYDECLDEANVVGMNNLSNLEISVAKSTARSYISQGYDPDYDLDIIIKSLKNEGRSDEYIELVLEKMKDFKNKEFSYRIDYYGSWDNGRVLHSFKKATLDRAEEDAKRASLKDPKNLYYVVLDDIMDPTTGWFYYKGKAYSDSDPELNNIKRTINNSKYQLTINEGNVLGMGGGYPNVYLPKDAKEYLKRKGFQEVNTEIGPCFYMRFHGNDVWEIYIDEQYGGIYVVQEGYELRPTDDIATIDDYDYKDDIDAAIKLGNCLSNGEDFDRCLKVFFN